jgi:hypothetical protein
VDNITHDLGLAQFRAYGARLEFRVAAPGLEELHTWIGIPLNLARIARCARFFPSAQLFEFLASRLRACTVAIQYLHQSAALHTFAGLSFAAYLAYFFSTVLHVN